jgi:phthiodiolone/phenolphthiodiolone dimycocerosates ketoreductase
MVPTRFGLLVGGEPPFETATKCAELAVMAERDGYDSVWMPDHLVDIEGSLADPWSTIGYMAATTKRVLFYTAVTDYQKVHPSKFAQMISTLHELSHGRTNVGIGAGEAMNLTPFGLPFEETALRVQQLSEYIDVIRLLWRSSAKGPVSYGGEHYTLSNAWLDQKTAGSPPKVCIGALGSTRMLKLIGRTGDGWLPWFQTPELYKKKSDVIRAEARAGGRDPADIEYAYMVPVVVSSDPEEIRKSIAAFKMAIVTTNRYLVEAEGVKIPQPEAEINFQKLTVSGKVVDEIVRASEYVPESLVRKACAIGSADDAISFIEERMKIGATHILLNLTRGRPEENLKAVSEKVLPYFRDSKRN